MEDYEWTWPKKIDRDIVERALTLDFLPGARNLVLIGRNVVDKTMIAKNICVAVLAGHSVLFRPASKLLEELQSHSQRDDTISSVCTLVSGFCASTRLATFPLATKLSIYSTKLSLGVTNTNPSFLPPIGHLKSGAASRRCHRDRRRKLPRTRK